VKTSVEPHDAIAAHGLVHSFGRLRALRGLDLRVPGATTLVMFGANGSGKTTLLRILAGLLRADSGQLRVLGQAYPTSADFRSRIGMLAHESMLYTDLTARENLEYYARLYRVSDPIRVARVLERTQLTDAAERPVRGFSRGMLQRLSLARAVLHDPDLLLLDEPFSGLDPGGCEILSELLAEQKQIRRTVILTTHDFARGLSVADRAVIIHRGRTAWKSGQRLPSAADMADIYRHTIANVQPAARENR